MPEWWKHAACRGHAVNQFFPDDENALEAALKLRAKYSRCPVVHECAMSVSLTERGLFGCMTLGQRKGYRRRLAEEAKKKAS